MAVLALSPEKQEALAQRLRAMGVLESDLDESFIRSGGHGGQNVNKVATCVLLIHRPSGTQVKCQTTRHQGVNRFLARHRLLDKIAAERKARADAQRAAREKVRRQKRKRSKAARERMLADKAHRSARKSQRRWVDRD